MRSEVAGAVVGGRAGCCWNKFHRAGGIVWTAAAWPGHPAAPLEDAGVRAELCTVTGMAVRATVQRLRRCAALLLERTRCRLVDEDEQMHQQSGDWKRSSR